MRRRAKVDANHVEIVSALRRAGATVQSLAAIGHGCPDILVGIAGRNFLMEIKDGMLPPSKKKLTEDETVWHAGWNGHVSVVESVEEALQQLAMYEAL